MAKHTSRQPDPSAPADDAARIEWLLGFLRSDINDMGPRQLLDTRDDFVRYLLTGAAVVDHRRAEPQMMDYALHPSMRFPTGRLSSEANRDLRDALYIGLMSLQQHLLAGMNELAGDRPWEPFSPDAELPRWTMRPAPDGSLWRAYKGAWLPCAVAAATDALMRWWPQLRRCAHCSAWFRPEHGRQLYHAPSCSAEARYQRFKPGRNHQAEYERRLLNEAPSQTRKRRGPEKEKKR